MSVRAIGLIKIIEKKNTMEVAVNKCVMCSNVIPVLYIYQQLSIITAKANAGNMTMKIDLSREFIKYKY